LRSSLQLPTQRRVFGGECIFGESCHYWHIEASLLFATTPSALEQSAVEPLTVSPRAWILPGSMLRLPSALLPTLLSAMRARRHLVIENLALRQDDDTVVRGGVSRPVPAAAPGRLRPYWAASR
jgi:hypothetical protein